MKVKIKKIVLLSVLTAFSLALFALELLIPAFPLCPAAKIGLSNIIILFMLSRRNIFRTPDCFLVLVARCLLSAIVTGRLTSVFFSLGGGLAALLVMILMRRLTNNTLMVVSISGAVFHNVGQTLVAILFYGVFSVFYMMPVFFLAGVLCGALTGACVLLINRNKALNIFFEKEYNNGKI